MSGVELVTDGVEGYTPEPKPTIAWSEDEGDGVEGDFYALKSNAHPDALSELHLSMRWFGESEYVHPLDLTATTLAANSVDLSMKGYRQTSGEFTLSVRNKLQVQRHVLWLETTLAR